MERFSDPPHLLQSAPPIQVSLASHIQDGGPGSASAVTGSGVIRSATDDWSVRRAAAFLVAGVTGLSEIKLQVIPELEHISVQFLSESSCLFFKKYVL